MILTLAQKILQDIGWPIDVVVLDFEIFFDEDYSIEKMSTIEYVTDDRFEFTGVVVQNWAGKFVGQPHFSGGPLHAKSAITKLKSRYGDNLERCTLVVANDKFEGSILKYKFGIMAPHVIDIQNIDRHVEARAKHSVAIMAERWGLEVSKGDTKQFIGLRWETMTEEQQTALHVYAVRDGLIEGQLFDILMPMWTNPQVEIPVAQLTLESYLTPVFRVNHTKAKELVKGYADEVAQKIAATGYTQKELSGNISFGSLLCVALGYEKPPMKMGKKGMILAIAKDDEGRKKLLAHENKAVRDLLEARIAIKSLTLHQKRVLRMLAQSAPLGGKIPLACKYGGAHTARWAGGEKINPQNFTPKIKTTLEAPLGYSILDADARQIEARGLAWVADQTDLVEGFRNGEDIYSDFAADILGCDVRKPKLSDPPPVRKLHKARRTFGKVGVLGLGYGMGSVRCYEYIRTDPKMAPDLVPLIESGLITPRFAQQLVATYRTRYTEIVRFWNAIEDAFSRAYRVKTSIEFVHGIEFIGQGDTVGMRLPSGRMMRYQGVRGGRNLRWKYGHLWGGVLTENLVQAMSRDIIAEQMLALRERGWVPGLTVHDSIVQVVPRIKTKQAIKDVMKVMATPPTWAGDWPLDVEHSLGKCYG